ncbi:MAG TPA: hypothetical protein VHR86_07755, partial [Armatimonadota bacterium]|nr:hypothetical protein [Armatimonadota bacterium]
TTGSGAMNVPDGATATSSVLAVPFNNCTQDAGGNWCSAVTGFVEPTYSVGDANRMVQADREGRVLWMMNEPITRIEKSTGTVAYGVAPNQITTVQKALNRPASAGKLSADTVLISDTGNDRVIAVDRGGAVIWEASEMYDPLGILPAGEFQIGAGYGGQTNVRVAHLSNPTDAVQWVSYYQPDPNGSGPSDVTVRHTLIADAGNYRVMEIVDMFRPGAPGYLPRAGGGYWYHVIVWASQTNVGHRDPWGRWQAGQKYQYTSVQPISYTKDGYTVRALCTVSNYSLSRVDNRRQQRLGASLVTLESRDTVGATRDWTKPDNFRSYLVDVPNGEQGYVSLIGAPGGLMRSLDHPATIRRFCYKWGSSGQEWHDLYADATGLYEWKVPADGKLPMVTTAQGQWIDPTAMYRQFWRETYQQVMKQWQSNLETALGKQLRPDPSKPGIDFQANSFLFEPSSVALLPDGGWLVTNRKFDRALSTMLQQAGSNQTRKVQVFEIKSNPKTEPGAPGDYNPNDVIPANGMWRFGFTENSLTFLFGPQLRDLKTGNDLGLDLVNPMYAVRTE